ncbi:hypothetical protein [Methylobacterium dankookense]|uniref:Uncharacterized protein n=1 Tax=Methylobacterium dankookense TaxID=560405 RepID=A0A564G1M9_9HYPH|nr:hypothetical protein [Methylobacterium dankookense]GJD56147.1 hypothetical protein IFDJLNFL_2042 [Methylobacterium dankookense]VUF13936.1 hypothetical protein MTDSW087_03646 [Methylobacterium dankookense]
MSAIGAIGLTLAFLAPPPPERPERPAPSGGHAWAAALVIGSVCLIMVVPMVAIWGFHRPEGGFRARCAALGGQVRVAALDGSGPLRCEQDGRTLRPPRPPAP